MQVIIDIKISTQEYLKHYQIPSATVTTHSRDGRRINFPANILQQFVTHTGIEGSFRIEFSDDGKFMEIERL